MHRRWPPRATRRSPHTFDATPAPDRDLDAAPDPDLDTPLHRRPLPCARRPDPVPNLDAACPSP